MANVSVELNRIVQGDCVKQLRALPPGCVDLAFADPPFNIGYEYDVYRDKKERDEYLAWSRDWISAVYHALRPSGTFWLAIGDEYAAELKLLSQEIGFHPRSWVIWYYTFGVNCKAKFSRSHAHLFYFVKDPAQFTFRSEELENRIPSARQLVYADNRANPTGRLPDDTWVLRPQDLADCFTTAEDTWYFPRVAGTFKERAGFHGCQMPEQLLGRIIRLCSQPGDLVVDPFSGSATTVAVAKKLGRRYLAFDLSKEYVERGQARLAGICLGDPLDGAPEPTVSAPATAEGKQRGVKRAAAPRRASSEPAEAEAGINAAQLKLHHEGLKEAFRQVYDGYSLDRVVVDPDLSARLAEACTRLGLAGDARSWNLALFRMRKAGRLADMPARQRTEIDWSECDSFLFASEIAWRQMIDQGAESLDDILCDPELAVQFDAVAAQWSPGHSPLEYRWGALKLRKAAKSVRSRAALVDDVELGRAVELDATALKNIPAAPGVYVVLGDKKKPLYAGEANNLRDRLRQQFSRQTKSAWKEFSKAPLARFVLTDCSLPTRQAYQRRLVTRHQPRLNLPEQMPV